MSVANFAFPKDINYTYKKKDKTSYIDHVIVPSYLLEMMNKCSIRSNDCDNVSDHLALSFELCFKSSESQFSQYTKIITASPQAFLEVNGMIITFRLHTPDLQRI